MNYQHLYLEKINLNDSNLDQSSPENTFTYCTNQLFGVISNQFQNIIPPIFAEIIPAFKDHFWGRKNKEWRLYNFQNEVVNEASFRSVSAFCNGYSCVSKDGKMFGFINHKVEFEISPKYFGGTHLGNLLFAVKIDEETNKYKIIDRQENLIFSFSFNEIPTFTDVVILILKSRKPLLEWLKLRK